MKNIVGITFGFVLGTIVTGFAGWSMMPGMMLHENLSPYGIDETVNKIKENATSQGWVVPSVKPLHKSVLKHGGEELRPIMLVNLCQPNHAFNILREDVNKKISVFMPCTISVYQKSDGKTYVGTMNAGLLGEMFGGTVAEVMSEVAVDQQS
ncbi:MAG: DUF302 domain-containing protein, partial [Gammaproteobacteria bacterium]|nr:DUF302 domain-containing protein [Gammaproteobacteria bacterium]